MDSCYKMTLAHKKTSEIDPITKPDSGVEEPTGF